MLQFYDSSVLKRVAAEMRLVVEQVKAILLLMKVCLREKKMQGVKLPPQVNMD